MHIDIYRCDRKRCREEKPAIYLGDVIDGPFFPNGWLCLEMATWDGALHFCSLDCLAIWARQERKA